MHLRSIWKMAWSSLKLSWRVKITFFFMFIFPLGFFFVYCGLIAHGNPGLVQAVIGPLVGLSVITNSLFGVSTQLVVMRERDMLRRYHLAPITAFEMIASRLLASYLLFLPVVALQFILAIGLYGMPVPASPFGLWLVYSLGYFALSGFGLVVAGVVNTMQEAQVVNQILFFGLLFLSGSTIPLPALSQTVQRLSLFLPPTLMIVAGEGLMLLHQTVASHWRELIGLALISVTTLGVAVALFRWEKEEKATRRSRMRAALALLPMLFVGVWLNGSPGFRRASGPLLGSKQLPAPAAAKPKPINPKAIPKSENGTRP